MPRSLRALVAAAGAVAVLAGCGGTASPEPGADSAAAVRTGRDPAAQFTVAATDLGIHSFTTRPELPTASIRLNCFPGWSWVNTARDEYNWVDFDRVVTQAEQWGYSDILYVFCSTPQWAGEPSATPDQGAFGPGSAQPPANMADFDTYVRAVMERYRGRIDGYEVWNEPGSPQFFTGTPAQMGQMTAIVARAADDIDPAAYVASAGFQTNRPELYEGFIPQYFADLRRRGWPIDVVSAHFYPGGRGTPESRVDQIRRVRNDLDRYAAPADLALWDTEVNYEVDRPGGAPDGRITGDKAAAWTAQTYLNGWRNGLRRTFWYLWTADYYPFPGIQMRPSDPSTRALQTLGTWVIGATYTGCRTDTGVVTCSFVRDDGGTFDIAWATVAPRAIRLPAEVSVCPVTGDPCTTESGRYRLNEVPVRIG